VKQIFVDTGAWYALIDRKDPDHEAVSATFREWKGRLVTSNFILDETLTLLRYRLGWQIAHTFGEEVREGLLVQLVRVRPADEEAAWTIFSRYRDKVFSFTDCTSFAVMERLKMKVALAFDSDFRAYGLPCFPEKGGK
jgi:predicted nucleic acid-binding protein